MPAQKKDPQDKNVTGKSISMPVDAFNLINERRGNHESFAGQVLNDMQWFWTLCRSGLHTAMKKITQEEAMLILDVLHGVKLEHTTVWLWLCEPSGLYRQVEIATDEGGLDVKWSVNKDEILTAINSLEPMELIAVLDWAKHFWNKGSEDTGEAVSGFLSERD